MNDAFDQVMPGHQNVSDDCVDTEQVAFFLQNYYQPIECDICHFVYDIQQGFCNQSCKM